MAQPLYIGRLEFGGRANAGSEDNSFEALGRYCLSKRGRQYTRSFLQTAQRTLWLPCSPSLPLPIYESGQGEDIPTSYDNMPVPSKSNSRSSLVAPVILPL